MKKVLTGQIIAMVVALMVASLGQPSNQAVDNSLIRVVVERVDGGYKLARFLVRQQRRWVEVARWSPIVHIVYDGKQNEVDWQPALKNVFVKGTTLQFSDRLLDPDGDEWKLGLTIHLKPKEPVAKVSWEWSCEREKAIRALWVLDLLVGDSPAKIWGLLPGIEFLYDGEPSSNPRDFAPPLHDRRTPNTKKLTIPLMAVTIGEGSITLPENADKFFCPDSLFDMPKVSSGITSPPTSSRVKLSPQTVVLFWNPLQRWDDERFLPSVRFESPRSNGKGHRLGLFLPSCP
ncbi:MAG: hypothetical protein ACK40X_08145, partial [Armatimonadota bacterium]